MCADPIADRPEKSPKKTHAESSRKNFPKKNKKLFSVNAKRKRFCCAEKPKKIQKSFQKKTRKNFPQKTFPKNLKKIRHIFFQKTYDDRPMTKGIRQMTKVIALPEWNHS